MFKITAIKFCINFTRLVKFRQRASLLSTEKYAPNNELLNIEEKNALVTGGANGTGLSCICQLLKRGANKILLVDQDEKNGQSEANRMNQVYERDCVKFVKADMSDKKQINNAYKEGLSYFNGQMDIVFNNVELVNDKCWEDSVETNMCGLVHSTFLGLRHMNYECGGRGGVILNSASICGFSAWANLPIYAATKHFVIGFTRSLAMPFYYVKSKVRVMALCPGITGPSLYHNILFPELAVEYVKELSSLQKQKNEYITNACLYMIRYCENGELVVSEGEMLYTVNVPNRSEMAVQAILDRCGFAENFLKGELHQTQIPKLNL